MLLAGITACSQSTIEAPPPFKVDIQASRTTAAPGDTIAFVVTAQGGNLVGFQLDYGDNGTDQYGTGGARTARVTFRHAYLAPGAFTVRVTATDALSGQMDATVNVRVN